MPQLAAPPLTAPPSAIVEGGRYRFGSYNAPIPVVNQVDAGGGGRVQRLRRSLGIKEWEAFQLGDDDWFVLGAVYTAKSMGLLQTLVVNKHDATIQRYETKVPGWVPKVARGLSGTRSHGHRGGFSVTIGNDLADGRVTVDATHPGNAGLAPMELHGVGRCGPADAGHLAIVHPFANGRSLYSHKTMMPFDGTLRLGGDDVGFATNRGFLIVDDHHGEYPRPMRYDWLTGVRRDPLGRVEGFNLTDNQVQNPDEFNENALWIGNEVHRLPAISVERPDGPHGRWRARDRSGAVDVTFTPTVRSALHVGPGKRIAEYYAPYGWFEGTIEAPGARLDLDGFFGMGELKNIRL